MFIFQATAHIDVLIAGLFDMAKLQPVQSGDKVLGYLFFCPGCCEDHVFWIHLPQKHWTFNGDMEKPSFTPSLLNTRPGDKVYRCHLIVTDGKINYCSDCSHGFAGKTTDLVDLGD